jgi:hypothetical protein
VQPKRCGQTPQGGSALPRQEGLSCDRPGLQGRSYQEKLNLGSRLLLSEAIREFGRESSQVAIWESGVFFLKTTTIGGGFSVLISMLATVN